jgi:four helix bundle protein
MQKREFRTYDLAVSFYHDCKHAKVPSYLKNQLLRASSSVALNLREGAAKASPLDRKRFYGIAYASVKECQAVLDLECDHKLNQAADKLAAHSYKLWRCSG